jgi:site-specific DNA recombinase
MRGLEVRAALYARVSSEQQAQAGTIGSQVQALRERIAQDGLGIDGELEFIDEGYSGATLVRPALERLRDMAAVGCVDRLYVHSPDRLARRYAYQVLLVDELRRYGVQIEFLNHGVGESPEESLLLQVQGMVAEYERAKILERVRRGKLHAARRGSVAVLSGAPYGYRYVPAGQEGQQACYEIVLEEARIVRQVFEWIARDGRSIGWTCKRLRESKIPTRTGKSWWDRTVVWAMLKNPAYKGTAAFGKTRVGDRRPSLRPLRGAPEQPRWAYSTYEVPPKDWIYIPVPAIIGEGLFEAAQERLAENRKRSRERARGARHLLQGLVVCAKCGYAYYGKPISLASAKRKTRRYVYYRCVGTDSYRFGGQRVCWNKQIRSDRLEEAVWRDVCSVLSNPQRIEQEWGRRLAEKPEEGWDGSEQLRRSIDKIRRGISRLIDSYQDGLLEKTEFEPRIRRAKDRLATLQSDLKRCLETEESREAVHLVIGRMREFASKVTDGLEAADWSTRRAIIRAVVKRVEIDEQEVRVIYKITPDSATPDQRSTGLQHCWGRNHTPLGGSLFRVEQLAVLHNPRLQPLADQTYEHSVSHPLLENLPKVGVIQVVERVMILIPHSITHKSTMQRKSRLQTRDIRFSAVISPCCP